MYFLRIHQNAVSNKNNNQHIIIIFLEKYIVMTDQINPFQKEQIEGFYINEKLLELISANFSKQLLNQQKSFTQLSKQDKLKILIKIPQFFKSQIFISLSQTERIFLKRFNANPFDRKQMHCLWSQFRIRRLRKYSLMFPRMRESQRIQKLFEQWKSSSKLDLHEQFRTQLAYENLESDQEETEYRKSYHKNKIIQKIGVRRTASFTDHDYRDLSKKIKLYFIRPTFIPQNIKFQDIYDDLFQKVMVSFDYLHSFQHFEACKKRKVIKLLHKRIQNFCKSSYRAVYQRNLNSNDIFQERLSKMLQKYKVNEIQSVDDSKSQMIEEKQDSDFERNIKIPMQAENQSQIQDENTKTKKHIISIQLESEIGVPLNNTMAKQARMMDLWITLQKRLNQFKKKEQSYDQMKQNYHIQRNLQPQSQTQSNIREFYFDQTKQRKALNSGRNITTYTCKICSDDNITCIKRHIGKHKIQRIYNSISNVFFRLFYFITQVSKSMQHIQNYQNLPFDEHKVPQYVYIDKRQACAKWEQLVHGQSLDRKSYKFYEMWLFDVKSKRQVTLMKTSYQKRYILKGNDDDKHDSVYPSGAVIRRRGNQIYMSRPGYLDWCCKLPTQINRMWFFIGSIMNNIFTMGSYVQLDQFSHQQRFKIEQKSGINIGLWMLSGDQKYKTGDIVGQWSQVFIQQIRYLDYVQSEKEAKCTLYDKCAQLNKLEKKFTANEKWQSSQLLELYKFLYNICLKNTNMLIRWFKQYCISQLKGELQKDQVRQIFKVDQNGQILSATEQEIKEINYKT